MSTWREPRGPRGKGKEERSQQWGAQRPRFWENITQRNWREDSGELKKKGDGRKAIGPKLRGSLTERGQTVQEQFRSRAAKGTKGPCLNPTGGPSGGIQEGGGGGETGTSRHSEEALQKNREGRTIRAQEKKEVTEKR